MKLNGWLVKPKVGGLNNNKEVSHMSTKYVYDVKKSRIEHTCSICGKVIPKGDPYSYNLIPNTVAQVIACTECKHK